MIGQESVAAHATLVVTDNIAIDAAQKVTEDVTVLNALLSPWLLLVLFDGQKTNTLQSLHSGAGLLLYFEEYLSGEPVGGGGVWGQACKVPPHTSLVQELPLTTMKLWSSRTQETVKEGGELCPGQHAWAVLEEEDQGVGRGAVEGEEEGAGRGRHGCWMAQVRNVVR